MATMFSVRLFAVFYLPRFLANYPTEKLLDTLCREDYDELVSLLRPEIDEAKKLNVHAKQVNSVCLLPFKPHCSTY